MSFDENGEYIDIADYEWMHDDDPVLDHLCHCGRLTMNASGSVYAKDYPNMAMSYCFDCADNRCDTSEGMEQGCPNA